METEQSLLRDSWEWWVSRDRNASPDKDMGAEGEKELS